jgi:hypothetical protein
MTKAQFYFGLSVPLVGILVNVVLLMALGRRAERPLPIYENRTQIRLGRAAQRRWPAAIQSAALRLRRHDAEASDSQCPSLRETRGV